MKIVAFEGQGGPRLGVVEGDQVVDLQAADSKVPNDLREWLAKNNGDTCEVEIQGIGVLRNPIADE